MIGAIIGDTVGSIYEFNNHRSKDFPLFSETCEMTDDSILTLAVMEIMQNRWYKDRDKIIDTIKKWGRAYPFRGYGGRFGFWLQTDSREAYGSYGNGAAMRISPVGYYATSESMVKEASRAITEVTHNHPEGIKGAEVTAMCIYYAKIGKSKEFIKDYASKYYNLDFDLKTLRENYVFNETSQDTVPEAIYAFLISKDFEDAIRIAISIGGDSDTLACITGGISEAYYKHIDKAILAKLLDYVPEAYDGCNPLALISEYLSDRLNVFTSCEEINENTIILSKLNKKSKELSFSYSSSRELLVDYMIELIYEDFNLMLEGGKEIDYALAPVDSELNKLFLCSNIEELNTTLAIISPRSYCKYELRLYNKAKAMELLGKDILSNNGTNLALNDIFNNSYKLNK